MTKYVALKGDKPSTMYSRGQYTLKSLENFVGKENVLYGDTDSISLVGANDKIIAEAKDKFNVRLEVDKVWKILFLTSNKKQYVGLTEKGELVHKSMTGMKSNQPLYYNEVAQKLISKEFLEAFIDMSVEIALERIIKYIRSAFAELHLSNNLDKLSFHLNLKMHCTRIRKMILKSKYILKFLKIAVTIYN
jgi:DNA polymerase elongation subunit (family B)